MLPLITLFLSTAASAMRVTDGLPESKSRLECFLPNYMCLTPRTMP